MSIKVRFITSGGTKIPTFWLQNTIQSFSIYDQTGPTEDGSLNVSSITDSAAGRFYDTFTTSFEDTKYMFHGTGCGDGTDSHCGYGDRLYQDIAVTGAGFASTNPAGTFIDKVNWSYVIGPIA